ncbi:hypothetical protein IMZ38_02990 [Thermosphaera chiliense]|uniref:DUF4129 domain-containing protein n=1 Tax=Thermosphaera chiliense TaxID=3402707 RepID=A0A7M1UUV5_9CREN|nr:hypothetical protein [Thermosphaera aggregans]QOR94894.1 hypothetical protein IMZ38_02990 [Thermosphaera aggregans]
MRLVATVAVILLATLILQTLLVETLSTPQPVTDCTYLLAVFKKVLTEALDGSPVGEYYARVMLETRVEPTLSSLHEKVYRAFLKYYSLLSGEYEGSEALRILGEVYEGVDSVTQYLQRLHSCSQDRESAYALRASAELMLEELKSRIWELKAVISQRDSPLTITTNRDTYRAGEDVLVTVAVKNSSCMVSNIYLSTGVEVLGNTIFQCNSTECNASIPTPPAYLVEKYVGREGAVKITVMAEAVCGEMVYKPYRRITVLYSRPRIALEAPSKITRGEYLNLTIYSETSVEIPGIVSVRNRAGETLIGNITVAPTPLVIGVNTSMYNFTLGENLIRLCVNSTETTLSYCIDKPVFYEPRHPRLEIMVPSIILTTYGEIPVLIQGDPGNDLLVEVESKGLFTSRVSSILNINCSLRVLGSVLPLSLIEVVVSVRDPSGYYDPYSYTTRVVVFNTLSLILTLILGVSSTIILRDREKVFFIFLEKGLRRGVEKMSRGIRDLTQDLLKPYVTGLGSAVALVYYKLLRRLTQRLPLAYETLREHYSLVVENVVGNRRVKELAWKLLILAEKDMYSKEKPSIEEAKEVYESVLSEEEA